MKGIINKVSGKVVSRLSTVLQKVNPKVFFMGGILGIAGTIWVTFKKAPAIKNTLEELDEELTLFREAESNPYYDGALDHLKPNYKEYGMRLFKDAALPILCGLLTLGLFSASNHMLSRRVAAVTSAYTMMSQEYVDYRKEIVNLYGKEVDKKVYKSTQYSHYTEGAQAAQTPAYKVDDSMMYKKESLSSFMVTDMYQGIEPSQADEDMGRKFAYLQAHLHDQGYLLLNEVRDTFGVERIPAGHYMGWKWEDDFELEWTPMHQLNDMTGELLYDPSVHFVCDYEITLSMVHDITDEITLGKI